jgi:hypothetical protein
VLDAADDALYAAKAAGRDGYHLATATATGSGSYAVVEEIAVPSGASPPEDGLPRAGGGASTGAQPPRQSRGG